MSNGNSIIYDKWAMQINSSPQCFRFARGSATMRKHFDGHISLWFDPRLIGLYDAHETARHQERSGPRTGYGQVRLALVSLSAEGS